MHAVGEIEKKHILGPQMKEIIGRPNLSKITLNTHDNEGQDPVFWYKWTKKYVHTKAQLQFKMKAIPKNHVIVEKWLISGVNSGLVMQSK